MSLKTITTPIYDRYSKAIGAVDFPATLDIELTNNCNVDCVMCSRSRMKRQIGSMDAALLEKIADEVRSYPVRSIGLHLFGEPLTHPDPVRMIRIVKERVPGASLLLSTNACLLTPEISRRIVASGLDRIRFSLDGLDPSVYENLRRGSDFNRVMDNITEFIRIRDAAGASRPSIQMQVIEMRDTAPQIGRYRRFWKPVLGADDRIIVQKFVTFGGKVPDRTRFGMASVRDRLKRRLPCLRLWKNLVIYWDGRVSACCYDYDGECLAGDVKSNTICEIWKGPKMNEMRRAQLAGEKAKNALCGSCVAQAC